MIAAAIVLVLAAAALYAPGLIDRLAASSVSVEEHMSAALDAPDLEGNVAFFDRQGVKR